jgi:hypothetical protein
MTRARDFLYVLWPLRYYHKSAGVSDNHSYAQRSRFLSEEVVRTMDLVAPAEFGHNIDDTPVTVRHDDITTRIKDMWT